MYNFINNIRNWKTDMNPQNSLEFLREYTLLVLWCGDRDSEIIRKRKINYRLITALNYMSKCEEQSRCVIDWGLMRLVSLKQLFSS